MPPAGPRVESPAHAAGRVCTSPPLRWVNCTLVQTPEAGSGVPGSAFRPRVDDLDAGVAKITNVSSCQGGISAPADRRDLGVCHADRRTRSFATQDDVRVVRGRNLVVDE